MTKLNSSEARKLLPSTDNVRSAEPIGWIPRTSRQTQEESRARAISERQQMMAKPGDKK